jgi:hypothetical protein
VRQARVPADPGITPAVVDRTVTKMYGRESLLGFLSPLLAYVMAGAGMNGSERRAERDMQADAAVMEARGYRVVSADEYRWPVLGIAWFRVVHELRQSLPRSN